MHISLQTYVYIYMCVYIYIYMGIVSLRFVLKSAAMTLSHYFHIASVNRLPSLARFASVISFVSVTRLASVIKLASVTRLASVVNLTSVIRLAGLYVNSHIDLRLRSYTLLRC